MKKFLMIFGFLILSCKSEKINSDIAAQKEVSSYITYIKKQYVRLSKGKDADFSKVNDIVNLSGIVPKSSMSNFFGIQYSPTIEEISIWEDWFQRNKDHLSFYENKAVRKYYNKKPILKFEFEPNKFRYSVSEPELKRILEITKKIKENSNN